MVKLVANKGGMIFNCHFCTIIVINRVLQPKFVKLNNADTPKEGGSVTSSLVRPAVDVNIHSRVKKNNNIRSTVLEYLTILGPIFLDKIYSMPTIRETMMRKGREMTYQSLEESVSSASLKMTRLLVMI